MNQLVMKHACTQQESDALVASLRLLAGALVSGAVTPADGDIGAILTCSGKHPGLTEEQVHELADRLLENQVVLEKVQVVVRTVAPARHGPQYVIDKLTAFIDAERDKGADEGFACDIAESLKNEAEAGGPGCLKKLPPMKQSILDYVLEDFVPGGSDEEG